MSANRRVINDINLEISTKYPRKLRATPRALAQPNRQAIPPCSQRQL